MQRHVWVQLDEMGKQENAKKGKIKNGADIDINMVFNVKVTDQHDKILTQITQINLKL